MGFLIPSTLPIFDLESRKAYGHLLTELYDMLPKGNDMIRVRVVVWVCVRPDVPNSAGENVDGSQPDLQNDVARTLAVMVEWRRE